MFFLLQLAYTNAEGMKDLWCSENHFLIKVTIANYNLWTAAPTNLKSVAGVVVDI